jgi:transcriptional regulator with XRE-family HTH domain
MGMGLNNMLVSKRLIELREERDLSQKELAGKLGVAANTISAYENESAKPKLDGMIEIARFFDVSIDYLVGLIDEKVPYARDRYVVLPNSFTSGMRDEVIKYIDFLEYKTKR